MIAPTAAGLLDVLSGHVDLDQALRRDGVGSFCILPFGEVTPTEDEVDEFAMMDRLLETLRRRLRFELLETASVFLVAETRALGDKADSVILLARWSRTPVTAVIEAARILRDAGAGVAVTMADIKRAGRNAYVDAPDQYLIYCEPASV